MNKKCNVCGEVKWHASWKAYTCEDCLDAGYKWCPSCETVQPISNFHKNGHTLRSYCKGCECKRSIGSKEASGYYTRPEVRAKRNESSKLCKQARYVYDDEYREAEIKRCHDRRTKVPGTLTATEWYAACQAFDFTCAYCGAEHKLTMDHAVPVYNGGGTNADNILPVCGSCNSSKGAKDMVEWYTAQPFYSKERLKNIVKYLESKKER